MKMARSRDTESPMVGVMLNLLPFRRDLERGIGGTEVL